MRLTVFDRRRSPSLRLLGNFPSSVSVYEYIVKDHMFRLALTREYTLKISSKMYRDCLQGKIFEIFYKNDRFRGRAEEEGIE